VFPETTEQLVLEPPSSPAEQDILRPPIDDLALPAAEDPAVSAPAEPPHDRDERPRILPEHPPVDGLWRSASGGLAEATDEGEYVFWQLLDRSHKPQGEAVFAIWTAEHEFKHIDREGVARTFTVKANGSAAFEMPTRKGYAAGDDEIWRRDMPS